jgi:hypothetical protein
MTLKEETCMEPLKDISPRTLKCMLEKGIEGVLFPHAVWRKYEPDAARFGALDADEKIRLKRENSGAVNEFIEQLLASMEPEDTARLLRTVEPLIAVLYRERLNEAMRFLGEGIGQDAKIQLPSEWSALLRILLLRKTSS